MRLPLPPGLWTLGAVDDVRLREREAMFVWIRWLFAVLGAAGAAADPGWSAAAAWALPALVIATNVAATALPGRMSETGLWRLGVAVTLADGAAVTVAMFNDALNADTATPLLLMLVIIEAALRWELRGGVGAGTVAAAVATLWSLHRDAEYGIEFTASTAGVRAGVFVFTGLLLGVLIERLEEAAAASHRRLQRTETVGHFAIEAPRLGVEEAAVRLATSLHDELDLEMVAVLLVRDGEPPVFELVATAGYDLDAVELDRYRALPVSRGVIGRCYRTGEAQLLTEVAGDPDYLEVDPTTRSEVAVPLRSGETVFGVLDVASRSPGAFTPDDLHFLEAVGAQVGRAFDNARMVEMERRTIAELERLSAMKDDFIAIANHELRTPVTTIAGFAKSVVRQRNSLTPEEVDDALERISRQSDHLKTLLDELLTLPRPLPMRLSEYGEVCIDEVTADVAREMDPRDGRHHFVVEVPPGLPPVRGEASAVRRVLTNLVSNAVKYSPDGGRITIRARRDGSYVRVDVADEGIGIDAGDLPHLFTKFGRASGADSSRGGMGLGLYIVKELVSDMAGTVGVDSEAGEGSVFWFRLPAVDPG